MQAVDLYAIDYLVNSLPPVPDRAAVESASDAASITKAQGVALCARHCLRLVEEVDEPEEVRLVVWLGLGGLSLPLARPGVFLPSLPWLGLGCLSLSFLGSAWGSFLSLPLLRQGAAPFLSLPSVYRKTLATQSTSCCLTWWLVRDRWSGRYLNVHKTYSVQMYIAL